MEELWSRFEEGKKLADRCCELKTKIEKCKDPQERQKLTPEYEDAQAKFNAFMDREATIPDGEYERLTPEEQKEYDRRIRAELFSGPPVQVQVKWDHEWMNRD